VRSRFRSTHISFSQHDWQGRITEFQARKVR
jgi:hypothetical protein